MQVRQDAELIHAERPGMVGREIHLEHPERTHDANAPDRRLGRPEEQRHHRQVAVDRSHGHVEAGRQRDGGQAAEKPKAES